VTLLPPTTVAQINHDHDHHHPDHAHHHPDHAHHHPDDDHHHLEHEHDHPLHGAADPGRTTDTGRTIVLEQQILAKNATLADGNRQWLVERGVLSINLMSSPGSGKTTLLERTIALLGVDHPIAVIEGDQETPLDAMRIRAAGCPVVQINTGAGCHLDAEMVLRALRAVDPAPGTLLFIENVGNLVCPALFDLGERHRVVLSAVTEGADKPMKYPHMFTGADLVLINKMDLLPYVEFDVDRFSGDVHRLNARAEILTVTATADGGLTQWVQWLTRALAAHRQSDDHLDTVGRQG
jgi:hydrogenase nickel incorporation protein HypB